LHLSHYPPARSAAVQLVEHFAREGAAHARAGSPVGRLPDAAAVEAIVDAAFWASLQREEGYVPEISLAYLPSEEAALSLRFAAPLPLAPRTLRRLGPAVERPGIHLGVWGKGGDLFVWGTTRAIPTFTFVVEVLGPGLLVVKHRTREDAAKFLNVAVFEGEQIKILSRAAVEASKCPVLLKSLLVAEPSARAEGTNDALLRLAVSMRAHGRGGTLLVVSAGTEAWKESIVTPVAYAVQPAFTELADLVLNEEPGSPALVRAVDAVAGLTAVDGATVINDRHELLAFGAKIGRPDGRPQVQQVLVSEPIEGFAPVVMAPAQLGGMRHISAAQFAQDQHASVALVASQDGRFTIFAWSAADGMVRADCVETLLF
jgi:hypothetical protein